MASHTLRGVSDVVAYIDSRPSIRGRAAWIWWLALGGLFLDAFSNSALSAGLGPMTTELALEPTQVALLTSMASWVALVFNPIGGWLADRYGDERQIFIAPFIVLLLVGLYVFNRRYWSRLAQVRAAEVGPLAGDS